MSNLKTIIKSKGGLPVSCNVTIWLFAILYGLVSMASAAGQIEEAERMDFSPDTIIVKLKEGVSVGLREDSELSGSGLQKMSPFNSINANDRAVHIRPVFRDFKKNQRRMEALLNNGSSGLNKKEKRTPAKAAAGAAKRCRNRFEPDIPDKNRFGGRGIASKDSQGIPRQSLCRICRA